ncbi:hypothetical protein HBNCFIEN_02452 [Legionella sp. PC997]|nr:hypothetical protein HBNCFIEN_02452 [Legionella sp. PC997]
MIDFIDVTKIQKKELLKKIFKRKEMRVGLKNSCERGKVMVFYRNFM